MDQRTNRTFICSVLFLDIVEYSQKTVEEQTALKGRFNALLSEIIEDIAVNDRIILDTGDGAARMIHRSISHSRTCNHHLGGR